MALPSVPFHRRRGRPCSSLPSLQPASLTRSEPGAYLARLWRWAEDANRQRLSSITLAYVMSGDTVPPISFSDFEAFLAFSDISLENLHFIVWFQDYQLRYRAADEEIKKSTIRRKWRDESDDREDISRDISEEHLAAFPPESPELEAPAPSQYDSVSELGSSASDQELLKLKNFRNEIDNIIATFLVPNSRKELLLSSSMRDKAISDAKRTTNPDIFLPIYNAIYESVESVSLPRFLAYAATNINRPRQLFWYFSSLPLFLLGVAVALIFITSSSPHFIVPPQSHRAWRLFSTPCFLLSALTWYKGYRGFCPLLWLRSSTQLRVWELESLADDEEAQTYVSEVGKTGSPEQRSHSPSSASPTTRIAPFLDFDEPDQKSTSETISSSNEVHTLEDMRGRHASSGMNAQFRSLRGRFSHPPIFGPDRVVEDPRIRKVHRSLLLALIRFGVLWMAILTAIVISVPSLHKN